MTASVFISSTFADMHAERDVLSRRVFPRLRERFAARGVSIYEVDLRWGVTEAMARSEGAVDVCLDEIERCAPLVVGIIGHRLGWVPSVVSNRDERRRMITGSGLLNFLQSPRPNGWSMTEIELRFAAMAAAQHHMSAPIILFRDRSLTHELTDGDAAHDDAVIGMRERIRALFSTDAVVDYNTIEAFELFVEERLYAQLEEFAASRLAGVTRTTSKAAVQDKSLMAIVQCSKRSTPVIVTGPPGVGASWILERYVGNGPGMLLDGRRSTIQEITNILAGDHAPVAARITLQEAMAKLSPGQYVVDHFEEAFGGDVRADLGLLALKIPPKVNFVVMIRSARLLEQAAALALPIVEIPVLEVSERSRFIRIFLHGYGKSLDLEQADRLASAPWASRIGALVLSMHELRRFGSFELLPGKINQLAGLQDDIALATEVLRGLDGVLPVDRRERLRPTIAAIAISLRGLEEHHICNVLAPDDPTAARYWSALRVSLGAALGQINGRTVLSSGPIQKLIVAELETERSLALDAIHALRVALAKASDRRRFEEAPRIAMVEGGEAALTALLAEPESVLQLLAVGPVFTEGWLNFLGSDSRRAVCIEWLAKATERNDLDIWPLAELGARVSCGKEALALIELDIERVPEREGRAALRAFLDPTPENFNILSSDLERREKAGKRLNADDVVSALALLDANSDGRLALPRDRLLELETAVRGSETFSASLFVQAHLAVASGQRLLLEANWKASLQAFEAAERLGRRVGDSRHLCQALERKAAVTVELRQFRESRRAASECLELSRSAGLAEFEALAFERLVEIEKRRANWSKAFAVAEAYIRRSEETLGDVARARRALDAISEP